jgi:hypothetical protein
MRICILASTVACLAGCTTMAGVQNKAPSFTAAGTQSAAGFEECLALRLSRFGPPAAVRGEGRVVLVYGQPNPAFTITIVDNGTTRTVEGRPGIVSASKIRPDVEQCLRDG